MKKTVKNFWLALPKPFFALAPMADVTDAAFRAMIAKYGKPDVIWTEFVSADGLVSAGREKLLIDLKYSAKERPIVAQIFSGQSKNIAEACRIVADLGFDGIDINMGCPDRKIEKQGGGAMMMKNRDMAVAIIHAAQESLNKSAQSIPISVKTRIGYSQIDLTWIKLLLEQKLSALTIHLRTRKEMSDRPAHWEIMAEIIKMRNEISPQTLIIGNGDVRNIEDGIQKYKKYRCDGIMIGRGVFGKPWLFNRQNQPKSPAEKLKILLEHTKLFEKMFVLPAKTKQKVKTKNNYTGRGRKSFNVMKKHFKAYVSGWNGAKELRIKLMDTKNSKEVAGVVKEYLSTSNIDNNNFAQ